MKKMISFAFCAMLFLAEANAQIQTTQAYLTANEPSAEYYNAKGRNQAKAARILLWSGAGLAAFGGFAAMLDQASPKSDRSGSGTAMASIGGVAMAASIPLFVSASNNKKKATSLALNTQQIVQLKSSAIARVSIPTVSFKINL